jgi:hypothetical protein
MLELPLRDWSPSHAIGDRVDGQRSLLKRRLEAVVFELGRHPPGQLSDKGPADHKPSNRLPYLRGLVADDRGMVYAAATSCHRLLKIAPDGKIESVLTAVRPWSPTGVAVHGGDVYAVSARSQTRPN